MKIFPIKIDGVRRWQPLHYMRGLSPQYWFILGVTVLVLAAIAVVTITGVRRVRDTAIAEAIEINTKYVVADEARVRLKLAILDMVLLVVREDLRLNGPLTQYALSSRLDQLKVDAELNPRVSIVDASGDILAVSGRHFEKLVTTVNVADRDHFKAQKSSAGDELLIGVPMKSRLSGSWILPLSRRIEKSDGSFGGLVFITVDPEVFGAPLEAEHVGTSSTRAIVGLDGISRIGKNGVDIQYGGDISASHLFEALKKSPTGSYTSQALYSDALHVVSYHLSQPYGLVLVAGSAIEDILASAAGKVTVYVIIGIASSAMVMLLAGLLVGNMLRQRKAFVALKVSAARYQLLFEQTPVMHMLTSMRGDDFVIIECNRTFSDTLGYARAEVIGGKVLDVFSPESQGYQDTLADCLKTERPSAVVEPRALVAKDGRKIYVLAQTIAELEVTGSARTLRVTLIDISNSEEMREALFKSEQRFRQLIQLIPQLVVARDMQGHVTWVNERTTEYLGVQHLRHRPDFDWVRAAIHPEDQERYKKIFADAMHLSRTSQPCEFRLRRFDDEYRWYSAQMTPILDPHGKVVLWLETSMDIHDRKMSDERLRTVQKMESVEQVTGGLAHDFNNLLAIIIGNLDLVTNSVTDPKSAQQIRVALSAAERGADLVKALLALASKQPLLPDRIDLCALLERYAPLMRHAAGERVNFALFVCDEKVFVEVDVAGLEAALLNLVVNARDAMPEGGDLTLGLSVYQPKFVRDDRTTRLALISVADSGLGMSDIVRRRATEPFFTTKKRGYGTGLGLPMVAGFVKQSGGELRIQSTMGQGSVIDIYLPMTTEVESHVPLETPFEKKSSETAVILVVDDEVDLVTVVCAWAAELGYTTESAHSAAQAMTCLASRTINLVVSDIVMPGDLDGVALAEYVNTHYPHTGVLLMSGYSSEMTTFRSDLPWTVLVKPFRKHQFQSAISTLLHPVEMTQPTDGLT